MNRSVNRAIKILELISQNKNGLTLSEVAEKMKMPRSSTYDILDELLANKIINLINKKLYVIGIKAFEIGSVYINDIDIISRAKDDLEELAEELNKTAFIGTLDDDEVLYIYKYQATHAKLTACNIGIRKKLYNSALGKALLAYTKESEQIKIIDNTEFIKDTDYTIESKEELINEIEQIRKQGFAVDNREGENHMLCFGSPIFDYTGEVVASVSIADLYDEHVNIDEIGEKISEVANRISKKLGYYNLK